jgi:hypothetical protein
MLASTARWRVAAEHSIMQKSELRGFIVRAEAVAKLTARYCTLLNLDFGVFPPCLVRMLKGPFMQMPPRHPSSHPMNLAMSIIMIKFPPTVLVRARVGRRGVDTWESWRVARRPTRVLHLGQRRFATPPLLKICHLRKVDACDDLVLGKEGGKRDESVDGKARERGGAEDVDALWARGEILPRHLQLLLVADLLLWRVRRVDHQRDAVAQPVAQGSQHRVIH